METAGKSLACVVIVVAMVASKVVPERGAREEFTTSAQEEFLSRLDQYEIAIPVRVGPGGETLESEEPHRRQRRSTPPNPNPNPNTNSSRGDASESGVEDDAADAQLYYQLATQHSSFLLNLTLQTGLLSRQFRVEYWSRGRLAWSHPYAPSCHYTGHLQHQDHSSQVALSNCDGLRGVIVAGGEEFLIEPLGSPENLTSIEGREGRPHVVYKRSSLRHQYLDQSCGVIGTYEMLRNTWNGAFLNCFQNFIQIFPP
ncbi:hypothetical protein AALO_G00132070 [Alosa alosa]|uniref:Peptidase M12B propeptide domain-containing protein n=1 Tax=Alosa alosa TaxID=278164 RepID=A0AAV6GST1_9TELE|nr:hypothetical protein AALO_G00132070 [Alosa alosa]